MTIYKTHKEHGVELAARASVEARIFPSGEWCVSMSDRKYLNIRNPQPGAAPWVVERGTAVLLAAAMLNTIKEYDEEAARWQRTS